jgi:hypothetical protein
MIEAGHGARFAFEPRAQVFPVGDVLRHHFDGDRPFQTRVARLPHFAHSARSERRDGPSFAPGLSFIGPEG